MAYFVLIRYRYGTVPSAHATLAGANQEIAHYVARNWDTDRMGPIPELPDPAVGIYFNENEVETYSIYNCPVRGTEEAPLQEDEVLLTPGEVAVVVGSLETAHPSEIAHFAGVRGSEARNLLSSAYKKLRD
jgi:hypothetical protein